MTLKIGGWGLIAAVVSGLYAAPVSGIPAQGPPRPSPTSPLRTTALSWTDPSGRPGLDAREALALLTGADQEGLDPADYQAAAIEALLSALDTCQEPLAADIDVFDAALTDNLLRYLHDLRFGRVEPRAVGFRVARPPDERDLTTILTAALSAHRVAAAAAELAPRFGLYRDLRRELVRYRSMAADRSLQSLPPVEGAVHPGERYAGLPALHRLLVAFGDLPRCASPVRRACLRRGDRRRRQALSSAARSAADGVLGQATRTAISVPLAWRVRQIELALERLRWLPDLTNERLVAVNIPMFRLWAGTQSGPTRRRRSARVSIVGRALNTRTPVFVEEMRYIIFRPVLERSDIDPAPRDPAALSRDPTT